MAEPITLELRGRASPVAPLQRWALALASLGGWRRHAAAILLGALAAAALPPVDLTPVLLVSFVGACVLISGFLQNLEFPVLPQQLLYLVAVSQGTYLTTKAVKGPSVAAPQGKVGA